MAQVKSLSLDNAGSVTLVSLREIALNTRLAVDLRCKICSVHVTVIVMALKCRYLPGSPLLLKANVYSYVKAWLPDLFRGLLEEPVCVAIQIVRSPREAISTVDALSIEQQKLSWNAVTATASPSG